MYKIRQVGSLTGPPTRWAYDSSHSLTRFAEVHRKAAGGAHKGPVALKGFGFDLCRQQKVLCEVRLSWEG